MLKKLVFLCGVVLLLSSFSGNEKKEILFKIERSKDKNILIYEVNTLANGKINTLSPININWKRPTGTTESLTWIQNQYAYGIRVVQNTQNIIKFKFVSYDKKELTILERKHGYSVIVNDGIITMEVNRIYVHFNGGSFWYPSIPQVDIKGVDTLTNKNHKLIIYTK